MTVVDIYCRISTEQQEDNSSLEEQEAAGRQFCVQNGFIVGQVHREVWTGYQYRERKKLDAMRKRYREGKIQGVVIRTLDRLSRSQVHNAVLMEEMEHYGVALYCVKENIDDTAMGQFVRMVLAAVAEMEREKIIDRSIMGRINAAKNGRLPIGRITRYGWKWHDLVARDYLVIDRKPAAVIRWASYFYARGVTCVKLVSTLNERGIPSPDGNVWIPRTLRRYLTDERNTGKNARIFTTQNKKAKQNIEPMDLPDGTYPAIVPVETFQKCMERAISNREDAARNGGQPESFLLRAGFIRCAECGHAMVGCVINDTRWKTTRLMYVCQKTKFCTGQRVPGPQLDTEVWEQLVTLADHVPLLEQAIQLATNMDATTANLHAVELSIANWQQKAENYTDDLQDGSLRGDTRASIRKLLNDALGVIERLEAERAQLLAGAYDKEREKAAYAELLAWCKQVKEARAELTYHQKRDFMRMLGVTVLVNRVNRRVEEMSYDIRVSLPSIQEVLQGGTTEIVGHHSTKKR